MINTRAADAANAEELEIGDVESEASSDSECSQSDGGDRVPPTGIVTVSGSEPNFSRGYIVAERVSTHGRIRPFEPIEAVPALDPNLRDHIGQVHPDGAIKKWLAKRAEWDQKYAKELAKWRKTKAEDRAKAEQEGFLTRDLQGERPPLASLAGIWSRELAREVGRSVDEISKKTSGAMLLWNKMSAKVRRSSCGCRGLLTRRPTRSMRVAITSRRSENMSRKRSRRKKRLPPDERAQLVSSVLLVCDGRGWTCTMQILHDVAAIEMRVRKCFQAVQWSAIGRPQQESWQCCKSVIEIASGQSGRTPSIG